MANSFRCFVIGCEHSQGTSAKTNQAYNFAQVNYLAKNDGWTQSKTGKCDRVGLAQKTLSMSTDNPSLTNAFKSLEAQFPMLCELTLDMNPNDPQKNWVVDIKPVKEQ